MTAYIYSPLCPIPTPVWSGSGNGNTHIEVWGAGILAVTYPIHLIAIEWTFPVLMWRVDGATMHNSSVAPTITPFSLRQNAATCTATTAMGTATRNLSGSTYSYSISGAIPSGTFNFLGGNIPTGSTPATTASRYQPASEIIVEPGSALWFGSSVTAINATQGGAATTAYQGGVVANSDVNATVPVVQIKQAACIYFEEIQEDWPS